MADARALSAVPVFSTGKQWKSDLGFQTLKDTSFSARNTTPGFDGTIYRRTTLKQHFKLAEVHLVV
jgi:hypothetical protein